MEGKSEYGISDPKPPHARNPIPMGLQSSGCFISMFFYHTNVAWWKSSLFRKAWVTFSFFNTSLGWFTIPSPFFLYNLNLFRIAHFSWIRKIGHSFAMRTHLENCSHFLDFTIVQTPLDVKDDWALSSKCGGFLWSYPFNSRCNPLPICIIIRKETVNWMYFNTINVKNGSLSVS